MLQTQYKLNKLYIFVIGTILLSTHILYATPLTGDILKEMVHGGIPPMDPIVTTVKTAPYIPANNRKYYIMLLPYRAELDDCSDVLRRAETGLALTLQQLNAQATFIPTLAQLNDYWVLILCQQPILIKFKTHLKLYYIQIVDKTGTSTYEVLANHTLQPAKIITYTQNMYIVPSLVSNTNACQYPVWRKNLNTPFVYLKCLFNCTTTTSIHRSHTLPLFGAVTQNIGFFKFRNVTQKLQNSELKHSIEPVGDTQPTHMQFMWKKISNPFVGKTQKYDYDPMSGKPDMDLQTNTSSAETVSGVANLIAAGHPLALFQAVRAKKTCFSSRVTNINGSNKLLKTSNEKVLANLVSGFRIGTSGKDQLADFTRLTAKVTDTNRRNKISTKDIQINYYAEDCFAAIKSYNVLMTHNRIFTFTQRGTEVQMSEYTAGVTPYQAEDMKNFVQTAGLLKTVNTSKPITTLPDSANCKAQDLIYLDDNLLASTVIPLLESLKNKIVLDSTNQRAKQAAELLFHKYVSIQLWNTLAVQQTLRENMVRRNKVPTLTANQGVMLSTQCGLTYDTTLKLVTPTIIQNATIFDMYRSFSIANAICFAYRRFVEHPRYNFPYGSNSGFGGAIRQMCVTVREKFLADDINYSAIRETLKEVVAPQLLPVLRELVPNQTLKRIIPANVSPFTLQETIPSYGSHTGIHATTNPKLTPRVVPIDSKNTDTAFLRGLNYAIAGYKVVHTDQDISALRKSIADIITSYKAVLASAGVTLVDILALSSECKPYTLPLSDVSDTDFMDYITSTRLMPWLTAGHMETTSDYHHEYSNIAVNTLTLLRDRRGNMQFGNTKNVPSNTVQALINSDIDYHTANVYDTLPTQCMLADNARSITSSDVTVPQKETPLYFATHTTRSYNEYLSAQTNLANRSILFLPDAAPRINPAIDGAAQSLVRYCLLYKDEKLKGGVLRSLFKLCRTATLQGIPVSKLLGQIKDNIEPNFKDIAIITGVNSHVCSSYQKAIKDCNTAREQCKNLINAYLDTHAKYAEKTYKTCDAIIHHINKHNVNMQQFIVVYDTLRNTITEQEVLRTDNLDKLVKQYIALHNANISVTKYNEDIQQKENQVRTAKQAMHQHLDDLKAREKNIKVGLSQYSLDTADKKDSSAQSYCNTFDTSILIQGLQNAERILQNDLTSTCNDFYNKVLDLFIPLDMRPNINVEVKINAKSVTIESNLTEDLNSDLTQRWASLIEKHTEVDRDEVETWVTTQVEKYNQYITYISEMAQLKKYIEPAPKDVVYFARENWGILLGLEPTHCTIPFTPSANTDAYSIQDDAAHMNVGNGLTYMPQKDSCMFEFAYDRLLNATLDNCSIDPMQLDANMRNSLIALCTELEKTNQLKSLIQPYSTALKQYMPIYMLPFFEIIKQCKDHVTAEKENIDKLIHWYYVEHAVTTQYCNFTNNIYANFCKQWTAPYTGQKQPSIVHQPLPDITAANIARLFQIDSIPLDAPITISTGAIPESMQQKVDKTYKTVYAELNAARTTLQNNIKTLEAELAAIDNTLAKTEKQQRFLVRITTFPPYSYYMTEEFVNRFLTDLNATFFGHIDTQHKRDISSTLEIILRQLNELLLNPPTKLITVVNNGALSNEDAFLIKCIQQLNIQAIEEVRNDDNIPQQMKSEIIDTAVKKAGENIYHIILSDVASKNIVIRREGTLVQLTNHQVDAFIDRDDEPAYNPLQNTVSGLKDEMMNLFSPHIYVVLREYHDEHKLLGTLLY